jgi:hypothetical protein
MVILTPFPKPAAKVAEAFDDLYTARTGNQEEREMLGDPHDPYNLPRPWDPAAGPRDLRLQVWEWCDEVAAWLNREYAWKPVTMIPACWPLHPHIARELPVLACLRYVADRETIPDLVEEWHRNSLPQFLQRMTVRLGESHCGQGKPHQEWPAAGRFAAFIEATEDRVAVFEDDVASPPTPLRSGVGP